MKLFYLFLALLALTIAFILSLLADSFKDVCAVILLMGACIISYLSFLDSIKKLNQ